MKTLLDRFITADGVVATVKYEHDNYLSDLPFGERERLDALVSFRCAPDEPLPCRWNIPDKRVKLWSDGVGVYTSKRAKKPFYYWDDRRNFRAGTGYNEPVSVKTRLFR